MRSSSSACPADSPPAMTSPTSWPSPWIRRPVATSTASSSNWRASKSRSLRRRWIAIGIGTTMNLHCDMTFATARTEFRTPSSIWRWCRKRLVADWPRVMGHQRAFAMFAAGIGFSAEDAREAGLVWKIVGEEELEAETLKAADHLASRRPRPWHSPQASQGLGRRSRGAHERGKWSISATS